MLNFLDMMGNYDDRSVAHSDYEWGFISTCRVTDGRQPYETAVCSSEYANVGDAKDTGGMTIVEAYDNPKAAQEGHDRWVKTMIEDPPNGLTDCCNAALTALGATLGMTFAEIRVSSITPKENEDA